MLIFFWAMFVAVILPALGGWFEQNLYAQTFVVASLMPVIGTSA